MSDWTTVGVVAGHKCPVYGTLVRPYAICIEDADDLERLQTCARIHFLLDVRSRAPECECDILFSPIEVHEEP